MTLIDWYRQRGDERLRLGVDDENDRAAAFWGGLGFRFVERRPRKSATGTVDVSVLELSIS